MNVLALLAIVAPALFDRQTIHADVPVMLVGAAYLQIIPGDSEYTWWIPWALSIAVGCFFWFYVRPRRRRK